MFAQPKVVLACELCKALSLRFAVVAKPDLPPDGGLRIRRVVNKRIRPEVLDCGSSDALDAFDQGGVLGLLIVRRFDVGRQLLKEVGLLAAGDEDGRELPVAVFARVASVARPSPCLRRSGGRGLAPDGPPPTTCWKASFVGDGLMNRCVRSRSPIVTTPCFCLSRLPATSPVTR